MHFSLQRLANRLTFRQLQVFWAVYKEQGYSKAGETLGLTQPAVSSQIRQLEEAIGMPVFEYVGRKLYCTAAGERLAASVNVIFSELEDLHTDLATLDGKVAGELRLVAVNTAQYVVPYLLKEFVDLYPQVNVSVRVVNRAAALKRLQNNTDDLVIMGMVPDDKPFWSMPFLDNELVPVVKANHPLLQQSAISAQDFLNSGLLLRENGSGSRLALEVHCQQQRLNMPLKMQLGSNDAIKHAVIAGLGVAVLPKLGILPELQLGTLSIVDVPGFPLRRSWCVAYPKAKHPTPAMRAFIEYVQTHIGHFERQFNPHQ